MLLPRQWSGSVLLKTLSVCACLLCGTGTRFGVRAQAGVAPTPMPTPAAATAVKSHGDTERGIELYKLGKLKEALQALKKSAKSDDAEAWHFLGLLYKQQGKPREALKSFEKALALRMARLRQNIPAETLQAYGELNREERARRLSQVVANYTAAADTAAEYVSLNPDEADFWRSQLASLHYYATHIAPTAQSERVYSPGDVTTRAQFLQRSYPLYTERARRKQRSGKVVLRVILASDGTVRHVIPLTRIPDGLTEAAVAAAQASSFKPAILDGRPVSVWVTIEYIFNLY